MTTHPDDNMTALTPDWVMATGSNAHAARDRGWFSHYTPFTTYAQSVMGREIRAVGVGDVDIPVKVYPKRSGPRAHGVLRLRNVLHIPSAICNIVGMPTPTDDFGEGDGFANVQLYGMGISGDDGELTDTNDRRVAYLHRSPVSGFWVVGLSGPPVGPAVTPSRLEASPGVPMSLSIRWPELEELRWLATRGGVRNGSNTSTGDNARPREGGGEGHASNTASASQPSVPPYTDEEKDWLKKHWDGEFKFLTAYGLRIHDEDDRADGRRMVRAAMHIGRVLAEQSKDSHDDEGDEEDEYDDNDDGHIRLAHTCGGYSGDFTEEELEFIEDGWGSFADFMMVYGLKFYKDEDVDEAKAIVRALMDSDGEDEIEGEQEEEL